MQNLTLSDNVYIASTLLLAVLHASFALLSYPFRSSIRKQPTLSRQIYQASVARLFKYLSIAQLQNVMPTSTYSYQKWIKSQAARQDASNRLRTEVLEGGNGAKIHWVGNESATRVIFYLHSGGFVLPLSSGHINLANTFRRHIINKASGPLDVKIALLEYTLAPQATYPTQFYQATLALNHILAGTSPSDVLICGDSAGGMLTLQILSHILHPYPLPHFPRILVPPETPFAGILAMSPWLIFDSTAPSYVDNGLDIISPTVLKIWADAFRKGTAIEGGKSEECGDGVFERGFWAEPGKAPAEWWHGAEKAVKSILVTSGAWEVLNDDIVAFGKVLEDSASNSGSKLDVKVITEAKGIHVGPTVDSGSLRPPNEFTRGIMAWVYERLKS